MRCGGAALLCAAALAGGCGGDDEDPEPRQDTGAQPAPDTTELGGSKTEPAAPAESGGEGGDSGGARAEPPGGGAGGPEDQPGGAGDEIPARSQALITGRDGRLSPRLVRVPPFISVRVELRSADGREYTLSARGKTISAGGGVRSASADFDGLRPGRRLVLSGPGSSVTVEASAEPGP